MTDAETLRKFYETVEFYRTRCKHHKYDDIARVHICKLTGGVCEYAPCEDYEEGGE